MDCECAGTEGDQACSLAEAPVPLDDVWEAWEHDGLYGGLVGVACVGAGS